MNLCARITIILNTDHNLDVTQLTCYKVRVISKTTEDKINPFGTSYYRILLKHHHLLSLWSPVTMTMMVTMTMGVTKFFKIRGLWGTQIFRGGPDQGSVWLLSIKPCTKCYFFWGSSPMTLGYTPT